MVNWEALGSIGELVSAIAVLATLIYLARQITDAKKAMYRQISQDVNQLFNECNNLIAGTPELASAISKAEEGLDVSAAESIQLRALFVSQVNGFENMYNQIKDTGQLIALDEFAAMFQAFMKQPWTSQYWDEYQVYFGGEFRTFVSERNLACS